MGDSELSSKSVLFVGLTAYGAIGGMQQFNRCVLRALASIAEFRDLARVDAWFLSDPQAIRHLGPLTVEGFGRNLPTFLRRFVRVLVRPPELFLIGHIDLIPMGVVLKVLRPSCRQILFVHGIEAWGNSQYRRMKPLERACVRFAVSCISAVSRFTAERMATAYGLSADRFLVLSPAVSEMGKVPPQRVFWRDAVRQPRIMSVGRLDPLEMDKGFPAVLRGLALLRNRYPGLRYTIVGDGPLRPHLEAMSEDLNVADMVDFVGRVSDEALKAKYLEADVFVLPSKKEGFGIVFLEAWQFGLPVVCGNIDASSELVTDGQDGYTVDPDSPDAIAEAVSRLLEDPALARRFADAGFAKTRRLYSDHRFIRNFREFLAAVRGRKAA